MPAPVPPRRSPGNLPAEITTFVGRRGERTDIKRLLSGSRLLTLTGFGGVGKTRLALRAAEDLQRAFADGAWLVELATLTDPALLADTTAKTLGLRTRGRDSAVDALVGHLGTRDLLLVLDNCEHLLDACALLVGTLLRECPGLRVLATSREPLRCRGETVLPVAPLTVPAEGAGGPASYDAISLFAERARAADPRFEVTEANRGEVAAICRRLDGIPLALELAAVRLRALSPAELLERLSDHFELAGPHSRGAPERQRTLRGCIEWSHELCTPAERRLWAQASVFAGDFEIDAVEAVCRTGQGAEPVVQTLPALVEKSILTREEHDGRTRYRMLEVIRRYGWDQLAPAERTAVRRRHRDFYSALVARSEPEWFGTQQRRWMDRLALEHPNLRAAMEFCLGDPAEAEAGLEIAGRLRDAWIALGALNEGTHWLERLLTAGPVAPRAHARALWTAAWLAVMKGDLATAKPLIIAGIRLARTLDEQTRALMTQVSGIYAMFAGDLPRAIARSEQALAVFRTTGDRNQEISTLIMAQMAYGYAGEAGQALERYAACLELAEEVGDTWFRSYSIWNAGTVQWRRGRADEALTLLRDALRLKREITDELGLAVCLETIAAATADSDPDRAAKIFGVAVARWARMGATVTTIPWTGPAHADTEARLRAELGDRRFELAQRQGCELDPEEGLDLAEAKDPATASRASRAKDAPLTPREEEVAALVRRGLTNKEIAGTLVIAQRTAETHVEHILTKLGFTSRAQIASWMLEQHS
ncbi:LuxR C-terminal-related transcriptional regulator [Amycolatopsis acidiphila]|uniref:LuxR family transcriptional regulator n=1 Tax=Amycolatopsis acidiphila TaxID=715473 RepID=A0A558AA29_9PSEU|nr:LuxR C-terminal-related transcriptional regulator [Amycolatopsis acidiphila]TVT21104.1 LuxR family transcriptional regulator [Amycolatopsis acidiphila]UIJ57184.1 LuxR C-terminal-related transcriptional regulator [Amycolatopsis acidiphila]GHG52821.1 LuxR family transcriptional regulator [Amycolatopsis acidiphila]